MASVSKSPTVEHPPPAPLVPLLSQKFNITDINEDVVKWNKEWEAAIASSSAADMIKEVYHTFDDSLVTSDDLVDFHSSLRELQEVVAQRLGMMHDNGRFTIVWILLNTSERERHIYAEITVSNFLSQSGTGFIDFLNCTREVLESSEMPVFLPDPWWEQASDDLDLSNPSWKEASNESSTNPRSASTKAVFEVATIKRNRFIGNFILFSVSSFANSIVHHDEGMKNVLDIVKHSDYDFSAALAVTKMTCRDKPLIRCNNCTKTPEEIELGVRFMVCSTCKSKLAFEVHYCSRTCQEKDWSVHKRACGKKAVSKGLTGTKGDSLWAFNDHISDMVRTYPTSQGGTIAPRDIGLGASTGKRSPAAQRQAEMLEADKDVDYFLFTASGDPVRFVIADPTVKMCFRISRSFVMRPDIGVEALAEFILKFMSGHPELSRDIILKQLHTEYGDNVLEEWERTHPPGMETMIETHAKNVSKVYGSLARMSADVLTRGTLEWLVCCKVWLTEVIRSEEEHVANNEQSTPAIPQLSARKENTAPVIGMASVSPVVEKPPVDPLSPLLSKKFNITDIKEDPLKWNKDWEAVIASSSAADMLKGICRTLDDSFFTSDDLAVLHSALRKFQEEIAQDLLFVSEHKLDAVWLLLNASEKRRHILEGLKKACEASPPLWGDDCRAFCPEITISNFLSQRGKGFLDFLSRTLEVFESSKTPAFLPNTWWEQASDLPNPWWNEASNELPPTEQKPRSTRIVFEVATIARNQFIGHFVLCSVGSIGHDVVNRSEGMKDVMDIVDNSNGYFTRSLASFKTKLRDKPLIRCENCTKIQEEIEQAVRFMVCGTCKSKLAFEVHYCSRTCQKKDWPVHKRACGKNKVSKGLSGTKEDRLWALPIDPFMDIMRTFPRSQDGTIAPRDIGVGPSTGKRSPAAERQAYLLEANKDVDYFLFTASGEPCCLVINDSAVKMAFRIMRASAMMPDIGAEVVAEYILKLASGYPGLSRDIILKQLCAEYGDDIPQKLAKLERDKPGGIGSDTLIESFAKNFSRSEYQSLRMLSDIPLNGTGMVLVCRI
ncbi:hypothetical protein AZE42_10430 [Rhizopogon vesiculosus]|uniref:MYND-type domain-containing protein n=1 Tax=Rhizopogon vesiculosus TaxID=180088 RepID=A0A1J8PP22_9AGAM|nr:hypothetical protein AZE42_10430 [Rhizopogon vesiculosus]